VFRRTERIYGCDLALSELLKVDFDRAFQQIQSQRLSAEYLKVSPQLYLQNRSQIVDWLSDVCEKMGMQQRTLHQGVSVLDKLESKNSSFCELLLGLNPDQQLKYKALMCFGIAAKSVELDPMPTFREILLHHPD